MAKQKQGKSWSGFLVGHDNIRWGWKQLYDTQTKTIAPSIMEQYKSAKEHYSNLYKTAGADKIIQSIQSPASGKHWSTEIEQNLKDIKSGGIFKYIKKGSENKEFNPISIDEALSLVKQWSNIKRLFQDSKSRQFNQQYHAISKQYNTLEKNIQNLIQEIKSARTNNTSINLKRVLDKAEEQRTAGSLGNALQGTLNGLLGAHLEVWLTNELNKLEDIDLVAFNTGVFSVNGKSIKEDVLFFKAGTKIKVGDTEIVFNDNGTISDQQGNPMLTLEMDEQLYNTLSDKSEIGLSAKTTTGSIIFHNGYNFMDRIGNPEYVWHQLAAFYHQKNLSSMPKLIRPLTWQRYVLSKDIITILGKKNLFVVSGNKFMPTHEYIDSLMNSTPKKLHFQPMAIKHEETITSKKVVGGALA